VRLPCFWNACTRNVCDPFARLLYEIEPDVPDPQLANAAPSSEHWKFVTDCVSVYENDGEATFDGFDGFTVIVGAGGGVFAANARYAPVAPTTRTPSSASDMRLELRVALSVAQLAIRICSRLPFSVEVLDVVLEGRRRAAAPHQSFPA
jgi:hypothetical protein